MRRNHTMACRGGHGLWRALPVERLRKTESLARRHVSAASTVNSPLSPQPSTPSRCLRMYRKVLVNCSLSRRGKCKMAP